MTRAGLRVSSLILFGAFALAACGDEDTPPPVVGGTLADFMSKGSHYVSASPAAGTWWAMHYTYPETRVSPFSGESVMEYTALIDGGNYLAGDVLCSLTYNEEVLFIDGVDPLERMRSVVTFTSDTCGSVEVGSTTEYVVAVTHTNEDGTPQRAMTWPYSMSYDEPPPTPFYRGGPGLDVFICPADQRPEGQWWCQILCEIRSDSVSGGLSDTQCSNFMD